MTAASTPLRLSFVVLFGAMSRDAWPGDDVLGRARATPDGIIRPQIPITLRITSTPGCHDDHAPPRNTCSAMRLPASWRWSRCP